MSIPVGVLSFPLLLHWTVLPQWTHWSGLPEPGVGRVVFYAWPLVGTLFCTIAYVHVATSRGKLRGMGLAAAGFVLASLWAFAALVFGLFRMAGN
jgi:hypothetical protein